jgi:hypothetical protein
VRLKRTQFVLVGQFTHGATALLALVEARQLPDDVIVGGRRRASSLTRHPPTATLTPQSARRRAATMATEHRSGGEGGVSAEPVLASAWADVRCARRTTPGLPRSREVFGE